MNNQLDEFHGHEVLHLASVVCNLIELEMVEHPWTQAHPKAAKAIASALSAMADAYQVIGSETMGTNLAEAAPSAGQVAEKIPTDSARARANAGY